MIKQWSFLSVLLLFAVSASAQQLPDFTGLVKKVGPAVVSVEATHNAEQQDSTADDMPDDVPPGMEEFFRHFFGQPPYGHRMPHDRTAAGSGFVISTDGYILTNNHVVDGADEVNVTLADKRQLKATIVGTDEATDLALLKVDADGLTVARLGDSDELEAGQWVVAIGSPFGLEHTVTAGIVSAKARPLPDQQYIPFIQTDVAINKGNSGGPLIDMDGKVVGINSQIFSSTGGYMGLSFSIPINIAQNVVAQLKKNGKVARGWLGVQIQSVTPEMAKVLDLDRPKGALVSSVQDDSPAKKAGIEPRDVIISFNGHPVDSYDILPPLVGQVSPGKEVPIKLVRDGKTRSIDVEIGELKDNGQSSGGSESESGGGGGAKLGLVVDDLSSDQKDQLDVDKGVVIERVISHEARRAGLRPGDVIVSLDNKPIESAEQFAEMVDALKPDKPVALLIRRGQGSLFVALTPKGDDEEE